MGATVSTAADVWRVKTMHLNQNRVAPTVAPPVYLLTTALFCTVVAHTDPVLSPPGPNTRELIVELEALASRAPLIPPIPELLEERLIQYLRDSPANANLRVESLGPDEMRRRVECFDGDACGKIIDLAAKLRIQSVTPEIVAHITLAGSMGGSYTRTRRPRVAEALANNYGEKTVPLVLDRLGQAIRQNGQPSNRLMYVTAAYFEKLYGTSVRDRLHLLARREKDETIRAGLVDHIIPLVDKSVSGKERQREARERRRKKMETILTGPRDTSKE